MVWRAPGQFTYGILQESLSKSIGNWCGKLLVNLHVETLRNSFQNRYEIGVDNSWSIYIRNLSGIPFKIKSKLVWNAPGRFAYKILKEFLSKSIRNWFGELLVHFPWAQNHWFWPRRPLPKSDFIISLESGATFYVFFIFHLRFLNTFWWKSAPLSSKLLKNIKNINKIFKK